jgi:tRNA dimethylallyltransferase
VPHHLIDLCAVGETFNASRYAGLADRALAEIRARGKIPLVVAGTGLYLRALLRGLIATPSRDDRLRGALLEEERLRPGCLHQRLASLDPASAGRIPPADLVRILRALEVLQITGVPLSAHQRAHGFATPRYRSLKLAVDWPRPELDLRIDARVDRMMAGGWLGETRRLLEEGGGRPLNVLGYRQLEQHLLGKIPIAEAVDQIKRAHRRYARKQLAWFKADPEVRWIVAPVDVGMVEREVLAFLAG